jgi:hypothetical protein
MENQKKNELKIELSPEVANGHYSNLTVISHSANEFYLDFISVAPNMPQAKVQSRIIMTPENAKNLLMALSENVNKYEGTFGQIQRKMPKNQGGNGNNGGDLPNPFMA